MVNYRKVRLMTRLAMYENGEGKEDLRLGKFFRRDYLRLRIFINIICVTLGYVCVAGFFIAFNLEELINDAVNLNYSDIIGQLLGIYAIVLTIFVMAGLVHDLIHYRNSRKKLSKYFRMLRKMRSFYRKEEIGESSED